MTIARRVSRASLFLLAAPIAVSAQTVLPSKGGQDMMRGFPPSQDKVVTRENVRNAENLRWALAHERMILPTSNIRRGSRAVWELPKGPAFVPPSFTEANGKVVDFTQWMLRTKADALLVMHDGRIVFEGYAPGVEANQPHTLQSVTKSFTGLAAAMLITEGKLDPSAPVAKYVPELAQSAWRTATVQQSLDMLTAVRYNEDLKDPNSDVWRYYAVAAATTPPPPGYDGPLSLYGMLEMLPQTGEHGRVFSYKTVNPEAIAWVISRITGLRPSEFISQHIWSQIGAEEDVYVTIDRAGMEKMGSGMSATARDLARFGEMLRLGGHLHGRQIVPATVVDDLFRGGDLQKFAADPMQSSKKGYSYHNFWWHPPAREAIEAIGGFGQHIHINRSARTVIIKLSSAQIPDPYNEAKILDANGVRRDRRSF